MKNFKSHQFYFFIIKCSIRNIQPAVGIKPTCMYTGICKITNILAFLLKLYILKSVEAENISRGFRKHINQNEACKTPDKCECLTKIPTFKDFSNYIPLIVSSIKFILEQCQQI